jgi:hypothetical protein
VTVVSDEAEREGGSAPLWTSIVLGVGVILILLGIVKFFVC